MEIKIERVKSPKTMPREDELGFGKFFTDHMFIMDYDAQIGWHDARIVPLQIYHCTLHQPFCTTALKFLRA